eukprot:1158330-Pelagomonas_calceolata.AAC.9
MKPFGMHDAKKTATAQAFHTAPGPLRMYAFWNAERSSRAKGAKRGSDCPLTRCTCCKCTAPRVMPRTQCGNNP